MATKKKAAGPAAAGAGEYEPERLYQLTLSRCVEAGGQWLSPAHGAKLKGKHIAALGDAVINAEPV